MVGFQEIASFFKADRNHLARDDKILLSFLSVVMKPSPRERKPVSDDNNAGIKLFKEK